MSVVAGIFSVDGKEKLVAERSGPIKNAKAIARETAEEILERGAKSIAETWRTIYA
jgi:porphobilinogen deaminase